MTVKHEVLSKTISVKNSDPIAFDIADAQGGPYFCFGVRKSGSTLLHKITMAMAAENDVAVVDIPGRMFRAGFTVADWSNLDLAPLIRRGNMYSGFRAFPLAFNELEGFAEMPKIFMFRDPRDALVSQYFSDAYSHSIPEGDGKGRELFLKKRAEALESDINDWVLDKCGALRKTMMDYTGMLSDENCLLLRYEDYVFQKRRLIFKVAKHFGWTMTEGRIEKILKLVDMVPDAEDEKRFIRKAVPGDHVEKLRKDTIRRLNQKLGAVLEAYDYY